MVFNAHNREHNATTLYSPLNLEDWKGFQRAKKMVVTIEMLKGLG